MSKKMFLSMCDVKVSLPFTSLSLVLFWQLFYLFCSSIVIHTVIVTARNFHLELLIDKTSSIYLYVKLKALASWIFLSFTSFWRNSDSYEYKNKSARRGAQFVPYRYIDDVLSINNSRWTRAIKRFALFDLLKSLYSDTKILSKYIPSLQKRL
jgi:hypothetical protein